MKPNIHPTFHKNVKVTCSCGNTFLTASTMEEIIVEICSNCHPFYTGKQKVIETDRVGKFQQRLKITKQKQKEAAERKAKKARAQREKTKKQDSNKKDN